MKVEHWHAQSEGEDTLRWNNLLGVCLGDSAAETGSTIRERHCDTARENAVLFLHPVEGEGPNPHDHLRYTGEGEVRPSKDEQELREVVLRDIGSLNLNAARLRRARREVYDALRHRLEKAAFRSAALRAEYQTAGIQPGLRAPEHCEVVRYHLRRWARKQNVNL